MAERRTVWAKISLSEQVDHLSAWGQLLYTWSIPHTDDIGVLPRQAKTLKGKVFPLKEQLTTPQVEAMIKEIIEVGLYTEVEIEGKKYLYVTNFAKHQTLKKDRNPSIIFPYKFEELTGNKSENKQVYQRNWTSLTQLVSNWNPNGSNWVPKGREGKGSEGKGSEEDAGKPAVPAKKPRKKVARKKPTKKQVAKAHKDPEVNEGIAKIIEMFDTYNVNAAASTWYGNTSQRAAAAVLFEKFGLEMVEERIKFLPQINQLPAYEAKKTDTVHQLLANWYTLENQLKGKLQAKAKPKFA